MRSAKVICHMVPLSPPAMVYLRELHTGCIAEARPALLPKALASSSPIGFCFTLVNDAPDGSRLRGTVCLLLSYTSSDFGISYDKKTIGKGRHVQWASRREGFFCQSRQGLFIHHLQGLTVQLDRSTGRKDTLELGTLLMHCGPYKTCGINFRSSRGRFVAAWIV